MKGELRDLENELPIAVRLSSVWRIGLKIH